jgi:hypothetical protein
LPSADSKIRVIAGTARRTIAPIRPVASISTVAAIRPVAARSARSAIVAVAVLALPQHRRRAGFMLVDADGEVADDVLVDAQEALDLDHRLGGAGDVEKREVRLAVLLDAERERLQSPRLDLGDRAAERGDFLLDLLRQRLDLLRRDVLARQEDVLVESHFVPFQLFKPRPTQSPSSPGKARTGSFEGGNTGGRTLDRPAACSCLSPQPSVQPPAGRNEAAFI